MGKLTGWPVVTNSKDISAGYGVVASDQGKLLKVTASAGDITISFASAGSLGDGFHLWIKKLSASSHDVIIDPHASETIDGESTRTLTGANETIEIISDGVNLFIGAERQLTYVSEYKCYVVK